MDLSYSQWYLQKQELLKFQKDVNYHSALRWYIQNLCNFQVLFLIMESTFRRNENPHFLNQEIGIKGKLPAADSAAHFSQSFEPYYTLSQDNLLHFVKFYLKVVVFCREDISYLTPRASLNQLPFGVASQNFSVYPPWLLIECQVYCFISWRPTADLLKLTQQIFQND